MKRIYKYKLFEGGDTIISLQSGAHFLSIQSQDNQPVAWFEVCLENPIKDIIVKCFGTGHPLPEHLQATHRYLGTVITYHGLVWHYYIER